MLYRTSSTHSHCHPIQMKMFMLRAVSLPQLSLYPDLNTVCDNLACFCQLPTNDLDVLPIPSAQLLFIWFQREVLPRFQREFSL